MTQHNPWLGLASYEETIDTENGYQFCGRDEETLDVVRLIDNNLFITLYGSSGIGKTSLLRAGVIPILRRKDYFPLYVRLSQEPKEISYAEAIVHKLQSSGLTEKSSVAMKHPDGNDRLYLWNYFATTRFLKDDREVYPVIILDQFEEVFREGDKAKAELLLKQIYLLLNDELEMPDEEGYSADTNYRFVASIREDFLFVLEDSIDAYALDLYKNNRYRLRPMKPEQARQVVLVPGKDCIEETEKNTIAERVISLARRPQSEAIDTLLLSLVCAGTYDKKEGEKISLGDLSLWKNNPMEVYYQEAVKGLTADQIRYIQQHLIREDGSRKRMDANEVKAALGETTYRQLTQGKNRLLSIGDKGQVELLHDQLGMAIYEERKAFEERERKKKFRRRISVIGIIVLAIAGIFWFQNAKLKQQRWKMLESQSKLVADKAISIASDDSYLARILALEILPKDLNKPDRPYTPESERALREATKFNTATITKSDTLDNIGIIAISPDGKQFLVSGGYMRTDSVTVNNRYYSKSYIFNYDVQTLNARYVTNIDDSWHTIPGQCVFSPNGEHIILLHNADSTLRIFDSKTLEENRVIRLNSTFENVSYHPDGDKFVFRNDSMASIMDVEAGRELYLIKHVNDKMPLNRKASGVLENRIICMKGKDFYSWNAINIRSAVNGDLVSTVVLDDCHEYYPHGITASLDGAHIAVRLMRVNGNGCYSRKTGEIEINGRQNDSTIMIIDMKSGKETGRIFDNGFTQFAFSPDGKHIVSGGDNTIMIWDVETCTRIQTINTDKKIGGCEYSPDGSHIIYRSYINPIINFRDDENGFVGICDAKTGKTIQTIELSGEVSEVLVNPDGKSVLVKNGKDIKKFDFNLSNGEIIAKSKIPIESYNVVISADNTLMAFNSDTARITVIDLSTGEELNSIDATGEYVYPQSFSPDGQFLIYSDWVDNGFSGGIMSWSFSTNYSNRLQLKFKDFDSIYSYNDKMWIKGDSAINYLSACIRTLNYNDEGNGFCITSYRDNRVGIGDATSMVELNVSHENVPPITAFWSPDGKNIVLIKSFGASEVLDANGNKTMFLRTGIQNDNDQSIHGGTYSPAGKHIAISSNRNIYIFCSETGKLLQTLQGHSDIINSIKYSQDGKYIVSASADKTIRVWDADTGVCIHMIEGHSDGVTFAVLTPDGKHIISASQDGTIRKWDFPSLQDLIDQTRERFKDRPLTPEERRMYYLE